MTYRERDSSGRYAPRRWWNGWAPALFIALLVGWFIYTAVVAKRASETVVRLENQAFVQFTLMEELALEIERLEAQPPEVIERIVYEPCVPKAEDKGNVMPGFPRDSRFTWR